MTALCVALLRDVRLGGGEQVPFGAQMRVAHRSELKWHAKGRVALFKRWSDECILAYCSSVVGHFIFRSGHG